MKIFVFGNQLIAEDSSAISLIPLLTKLFPAIQFIPADPTENWYQNEKELVIERVFNAPKEMVWKAWTDPETAKKWWGPKDFTAPSIKIDLREGGKYIFAMHGPEDSEWDKDIYSAGIYKEIILNKKTYKRNKNLKINVKNTYMRRIEKKSYW